MRVTKANAAEVAGKLTPAARKLLINMFVEKRKPVKVEAAEFMALIELMAKKLLRADMSWDNEPVTVLERSGKLVVEVLKKQRDLGKCPVTHNSGVKAIRMDSGELPKAHSW